jgi:antitoxin (DNA-binding transcriptional repressor) of toxin-antitoxin stability system
MVENAQTTKIGIRQFRDNFASYVDKADHPIAITRHGDTVGYYIPARPRRSDDEKTALKQAVAKLHEVLNENGISSEEVFEQLKSLQADVLRKEKSAASEKVNRERAERGA